jgi:hypothetical protein
MEDNHINTGQILKYSLIVSFISSWIISLIVDPKFAGAFADGPFFLKVYGGAISIGIITFIVLYLLAKYYKE